MSSLGNALRLLELLANNRPTLRVGEACRELDIPKSSVSRLLRTLGEAGLLERMPSGGYAAGPRSARLADLYWSRHRLPSVVDDALDALVGEFGFTGFASILAGRQIVLLRVVQGSYPLRYVREIGTRLPAWRTAMGRALLAGLPDAEVCVRLEGVPEADLHDVLRSLAGIREHRFVVSESAFTPGATTVAAAISAQQPVALGIAYPDSAVAAPLRDRIEKAVVAEAERLSRLAEQGNVGIRAA
jgi:DNA-binding IclR family transcriptional regulator